MKRVLHLVHRDPHTTSDLEDCRRLCRPGDAVLLRGAAAAAAVDGGIAGGGDPGVAWFVLAGDLALYGLGERKLREEVVPVDYRGFVELVCEYALCQSW